MVWFAVCFAGALVLTALAAVLHLRGDGRAVLPWIVAALVLYAAVLVITLAISVPLNNELAAAVLGVVVILRLSAAGGLR